MEEVPCKLENLGNTSNLNNEMEIKTEQEEKDMDIKLEGLHHSIDIKDETEILEDEVDEEIENQISSQLEYGVCNAEIFECNICDYKSSSKDQLVVHLLIHIEDKPFTCVLCNSKFAQKRYLKRHTWTHGADGRTNSRVVAPLECKLCGCIFMKKHHLSIHFTKIHAREKPREIGDSIGTLIEKKSFACEFCSYKVSHSGLLKAHLKRHSGEKLYACDICDYKSSNKDHLESHVLHIHTEDNKPFNCVICDSNFAQIRNLKKHMMSHVADNLRTDSKVAPLVCKICDCTFKKQQHLSYHISQIHAREKPREIGDSTGTLIEKKLFACEFCSYEVSHSGLLKAHLKKHSGEKLHACKICDRKFSFQYILDVHVKNHQFKLESGTGEKKPIVCHICDRKFIRESHFKTHFTRIHACENARAREMVKNRSA